MARPKSKKDLNHWLGDTTVPVFVIDAERRIQAFNAGCALLTGWRADEVVGEVCHYGSISEIAGAAALAASLCPPPEVFGGATSSVPAQLVHQQGHALPRTLHFFPLRDEKDRFSGVLGVVTDLSMPGPAASASSAQRLHAELAALRLTLRTRFGSSTLVARSMVMQRVLTQLEIARSHQAPVLFSGPAGSGKEHLARVIHFGGPARGSWFVPLDCRRLAADELERVLSRLVDSSRATGGGTVAGPLPGSVFLADVESLPRDLQERLVGLFSSRDRSGGLRLLAATCQTLADFGANPNLRTDFQTFVSPTPIQVPPLLQRGEDLPLLAQHFLEEHNRDEQKQVGGFDEGVWPLLTRYDWPGNLDELAAVVFEARQHAAEMLIRPQDLPYRFRTVLAAQELPTPAEPPPMLLDPLLTKVETRLITLALERSRNNKSKAAELLGINRARLLRRIEQLQIGQTAAPASADESPSEPEDLPDETAMP